MCRALKKAYLCYIAKCRKAGKRILSYPCPACGETIETRVPPGKKEVWDTLSTCPFCDGLHFKVARFNKVTATIPEVVR